MNFPLTKKNQLIYYILLQCLLRLTPITKSGLKMVIKKNNTKFSQIYNMKYFINNQSAKVKIQVLYFTIY